MSDYARAAALAADYVQKLWPTFAFRGWLATLLAQTLQAEAAIKYQIEGLEAEAARLRAQLEQTTAAALSLRRTIEAADGAVARLREREAAHWEARAAEPNHDPSVEGEGGAPRRSAATRAARAGRSGRRTATRKSGGET